MESKKVSKLAKFADSGIEWVGRNFIENSWLDSKSRTVRMFGLIRLPITLFLLAPLWIPVLLCLMGIDIFLHVWHGD